MTDGGFEDALRRVVTEKAGWQAPEALRMRVSAVPDTAAHGSRRLPVHGLLAAAAAVVVLVAGGFFAAGFVSRPAADRTPLTIRTQSAPSSGCMLALHSAELEHRGSVLEPDNVIWPYGYSAWLVNGEAQLWGPDGKLVAREGDVVQLTGGFGAGDDGFYACLVEVAPPPTPTPTPLGEGAELFVKSWSAGETNACDSALLVGVLARSGSNLMLVAGAGRTNASQTVGEWLSVLWPPGFSGRLTAGKGELLDPAGKVVAREGDTMSVGGGSSHGTFYICAVGGRSYP